MYLLGAIFRHESGLSGMCMRSQSGAGDCSGVSGRWGDNSPLGKSNVGWRRHWLNWPVDWSITCNIFLFKLVTYLHLPCAFYLAAKFIKYRVFYHTWKVHTSRLFFRRFSGKSGKWNFRNLEFLDASHLEFCKNCWVFSKFSDFIPEKSVLKSKI